MVYHISGKVKKAAIDSTKVWRHNGLLGQCKRAELAMRAIYDAETTTDECREKAAVLEGQISVLFRMLHTRRDQEKK